MNFPRFSTTTVPTDGSASRRKEPTPCCWSYANRDHPEGAVAEEVHFVALREAWRVKLLHMEALESGALGFESWLCHLPAVWPWDIYWLLWALIASSIKTGFIRPQFFHPFRKYTLNVWPWSSTRNRGHSGKQDRWGCYEDYKTCGTLGLCLAHSWCSANLCWFHLHSSPWQHSRTSLEILVLT